MRKRVWGLTFLSVSLLVSPFSNVSAETGESADEKLNLEIVEQSDSNALVVNDSGDELVVNFENEEVSNQVTEDIILTIAEQAGDTDNVTIHEIVDEELEEVEDTPLPAKTDGLLSSKSISTNGTATPTAIEGEYEPDGLLYSYTTVLYYDRTSNLKAQFIESVPRGGTVTLDESITITNAKTLTAGLSAPGAVQAEVKGELTSTKTYTYKKGRKFTGPDKGYSSKQYYSTRFCDFGDWKVTRKNRVTGAKTVYKGSYRDPASQDPIVNWSRNVK